MKHFITALLCLLAAFTPYASTSYTVYGICDQNNWTAENFMAEVKTDANEKIEVTAVKTDKYYRTDNVKTHHTVYSFTFEVEGNITSFKFHNSWWNAYTESFEISSGKTYFYNYVNAQGANNWEVTDLDARIYTPQLHSHIFYAVDKNGWSADKIKIHVWNQIASHTIWNNNISMTDTGLYWIEPETGAYYPVYKYEFELLGDDPFGVIFRPNDKPQSADLDYVEGKTWILSHYMDDSDNYVCTYNMLAETSEFVSGDHTYYFADTDCWGEENVYVHSWHVVNGVNTPEYQWDNDIKCTPTGKWVKVNDVWAQLYSFTSHQPDCSGFLFRAKDNRNHQTADLDAQDGALYYYAGSFIKVEPRELPDLKTLPDEKPEDKEGRWIYFNIGSNQMGTAQWKEPHAHFYKRTPSDPERNPGNNKEWYESLLPQPDTDQYRAEIMEYVRDGFYKIWCEDINAVDNVIFYYTNIKPGEEEKYGDRAFPPTKGVCDPSTWATYVYDIGLDCVHQSYVTVEAYDKVWEETPESIFVFRSYFDEAGNVGFDPVKGYKIYSDEGVYIDKIDLTKPDEKYPAVRMRLTMFDVKAFEEYVTGKEGVQEHFQRRFATANVGCIGAYISTDWEWAQDHIYNDTSDDHSSSREVRGVVNETRTFNNYNQYPIRIEPENGGVEAGKEYWLVIDLHPECHTMTLLEFDPQPALTVGDGEVRIEEITHDWASALRDPQVMQGEGVNGDIYFDRVNVLTGKVKLDVAHDELLEEGKYAVTNAVSVNDIEAIRAGNLPDGAELTVPYLAPDRQSDVKVRAHYTDLTTGCSFHSRTGHVSLPRELPSMSAPEHQSVKGTTYIKHNEDDFTMRGAATIPFKVDAVDVAVYGDISLNTATLDDQAITPSPEIIHSGHILHASHDYPDYLCDPDHAADEQSHFRPYDPESDEEYGYRHNWASQLIDHERLPVGFSNLKTFSEVHVGDLGANITLDLHAVYPYLILTADYQPVEWQAPTPAPRRAQAETPAYGFAIHPYRATSQAEIGFDPLTILSIDRIEETTDPAGLPATYYNLSGQQLPTEPSAPGVYLMRQGTKVVKIVKK